MTQIQLKVTTVASLSVNGEYYTQGTTYGLSVDDNTLQKLLAFEANGYIKVDYEKPAEEKVVDVVELVIEKEPEPIEESVIEPVAEVVEEVIAEAPVEEEKVVISTTKSRKKV